MSTSVELTGLPVRVWRDFTSAIGIRKAGPFTSSLALESGSYGRVIAKIVWITLKCDTQRAAFFEG